MRASVLDRTAAWRYGDPVSIVFAGQLVTGTAVVWTRESDERRFVKVKLTSGPNTGKQVWATEGWMLGVGAHELLCVACHLSYRSDQTTPDFCPACDRHQRQNGQDGSLSRFAGVRWKHEHRGVGRRGRLK